MATERAAGVDEATRLAGEWSQLFRWRVAFKQCREAHSHAAESSKWFAAARRAEEDDRERLANPDATAAQWREFGEHDAKTAETYRGLLRTQVMEPQSELFRLVETHAPDLQHLFPLVEFTAREPTDTEIAGWAKSMLELRGALMAKLHAAPQQSIGDGVATDDSAFVPAANLWPDRFDSYRKFKAWIDRTPTVRFRKPSANRLEIHAGDWAKHWAADAQDSFERMDENAIEAAAAAVRSRRKRRA